MTDEGITLDELAERSGVEKRTLRSWVAEGLLAPPDRTGRGARYPGSNVDRALAVRALKDGEGLPFAEIRRRLWLADEAELAALAEQGRAIPPRSSVRDYLRSVRAREGPEAALSVDDRVPPDAAASEEPPRAAARERRARPQVIGDSAADDAADQAAEPDMFADARLKRPGKPGAVEPAGLEALLSVLEQVASAPRGARRKPTSEWRRIPITPDLELAVRGDVSPQEQAMLERIADLMRAILTGGLKDDD